ncbi:MAG: heavy metal-associated domain-containing protein [Bacilli bacterium]|jgi:copper chaperone CopZ
MSLFQKNIQTVYIEGMMCDHCAHHVETELSKIEGIKSVSVSLKNKNAIIKSKEPIPENKIKDAVILAGYKVTKIE